MCPGGLKLYPAAALFRRSVERGDDLLHDITLFSIGYHGYLALNVADKAFHGAEMAAIVGGLPALERFQLSSRSW